MPLACHRAQLVELDRQFQRVARDDLVAKAGLVYPAEEWQAPGETSVAEHGDPSQLRHRLHHQHPGQSGATGKMALEEGLVAAEVPKAADRPSGLERRNLVHEQERGAVGEDLGGVGQHRGSTVRGPRQCPIPRPPSTGKTAPVT